MSTPQVNITKMLSYYKSCPLNTIVFVLAKNNEANLFDKQKLKKVPIWEPDEAEGSKLLFAGWDLVSPPSALKNSKCVVLELCLGTWFLNFYLKYLVGFFCGVFGCSILRLEVISVFVYTHLHS